MTVPVAQRLRAPLDVLIVRKLGVPGREELAMGAIAGINGSIRTVRDESVLTELRVPEEKWEAVHLAESDELRRREQLYRRGRESLRVEGRSVIVVDDGIATGSTVRAALTVLNEQKPARIIAATPVGAVRACRELESIADDVVCLARPERFSFLGQWYEDFRPVTDEEVRAGLARASGPGQPG